MLNFQNISILVEIYFNVFMFRGNIAVSLVLLDQYVIAIVIKEEGFSIPNSPG